MTTTALQISDGNSSWLLFVFVFAFVWGAVWWLSVLCSSVTLLYMGDIKLGGGGYVYVHWRIYIRYVDILLAGLVAIENLILPSPTFRRVSLMMMFLHADIPLGIQLTMRKKQSMLGKELLCHINNGG